MAKAEVSPGTPRETSNHINFRLPDGRRELLTLQEVFATDFLSEEAWITRVDWARKVYPDPKQVVLSVATESIGNYRRNVNKKFAPAEWEIEEALPPYYRRGHQNKNDARYRLNFVKSPSSEDQIRIVKNPNNPDRARILYIGKAQDSPGTEVSFIHKPYILQEGTQLRYLTETGWKMMDKLLPTLQHEEENVAKPVLLESVNEGRDSPIDDVALRREIALFEQTIKQNDLTLVNDVKTDRQGYVVDSRFRLMLTVPARTDGHDEEVAVSEYEEVPSIGSNGASGLIADFSETEVSKAPAQNDKKNGVVRPSQYALTLGEVPVEHGRILQNIPFVEPMEFPYLRKTVNRLFLERLANILPESLDRADDTNAYPRGTTPATAEAIIKMATFVAAFAQNRVAAYDQDTPISCATLKRDINTCLSGYMSKYPNKELTDIFDAVVLYMHKEFLLDRVYAGNRLVELYFSSIQTEEEQAFADEYLRRLGRVFGFCFSKTSNVEVAADLTQQVFANAWAARHTYHPKELSYDHYLLRIARNKVADHFRAEKTITSLDEDYQSEQAYVQNPRNEMADEITRQAERQLAVDAVNKLDEYDDRRLIYLHYWQDKRFGQIAEDLGISNSAARARHIRILKKLKVIIEERLLEEFIESERIIYRSQPDQEESPV